MDNRTEQLAAGVWRIEVGFYVNAYVIAYDGNGDGGGLALVDTGWRSGGERLVRSLRHLGLDPRTVRAVLLSHWHADHTGSAARWARSSARPAVHAGAGDAPVVAGTAPPVTGAPHTSRLGTVLHRTGVYRPAEPVPVLPLADGQRFEAAGGLEVLAAPGHTPGHCAFWLPERGVLLAGDAVWHIWLLSRGPRFSCSALPARAATLGRLAGYDMAVLALGHGPPVTRAPGRRLRALAERSREPQ
jgi:glyoxylase-like metal-dependent hydrolase (beta-lactamase superfamily II)